MALARASRRVPVRLWLRLMLGQWLVQICAAIVGAGSFAFAHFVSPGPDDPPAPLVAGILVIGCFPVILVGIGRARRVLYMLRTAPLVDGNYKDPVGEQADLPATQVPEPGFIAPLFVLPLFALAGVVALAGA